jgi:hypothetical protein
MARLTENMMCICLLFAAVEHQSGRVFNVNFPSYGTVVNTNRFMHYINRIFPCGDGLEYFHSSSVIRRRRRKGNPLPGPS